MAPKTQFLTNDNLTMKRWAWEFFLFLLPAFEFNDFVGTGSDSIVQMRTELGKGEGDEITFGIRLPLTGEGVVGNDVVEGNEEALRFRNFKSTIEELNHAVDTGGKMEQQRVPYDLLAEGKAALQDWWSDKLSNLMINHLVGNTAYRIAGKTFAQDPTAPDTGHHLLVNEVANEATLTSGDMIDLTFLDMMKQRAEIPAANCWKVRPIKLKGKNYYRVIMHNYVFDALKQNTNIGQWGDLLRAAGKLAMPNVEIEYNGMLITKSERIPRMVGASGTKDGVYRTLLLGAQAGVVAWGGAGESKSTTMAFVPYDKDAHRNMMVRGGGILGVKKTVFDGHDFGIITGSSWGAALT